MEKRLTSQRSDNFTLKTRKIMGQRGRITVPEEIRDELGLERGDIVSFSILDDDSAVIRRERLCEECVTESNQTDMMKLLVQAMCFAHPGESAQEAFEFLTDLTPHQRFELCKRLCSYNSHNFDAYHCGLGGETA